LGHRQQPGAARAPGAWHPGDEYKDQRILYSRDPHLGSIMAAIRRTLGLPVSDIMCSDEEGVHTVCPYPFFFNDFRRI
jgi:hypothetical protein